MAMRGQIRMDLSGIPRVANVKYKKQKWRNALQKYCDEQAYKDETSPYCVCGYMQYCDMCIGAGITNACVKAICELCKYKNIEIDYDDFDFEKFIDKVEQIL